VAVLTLAAGRVDDEAWKQPEDPRAAQVTSRA
jgi:hypothetical protein